MIWLGHGRNFFVTLDDLLTLRVPPPANDPTMMNAMAVAWLQCASLSLTISQSLCRRPRGGDPACPSRTHLGISGPARLGQGDLCANHPSSEGRSPTPHRPA